MPAETLKNISRSWHIPSINSAI